MYKVGLSNCGFDLTAENLFQRRKPDVFSTHKPNLGMWE